MQRRRSRAAAPVCDRWLSGTCLSFALTTQEQEQSGFHYDYSLFQLEFSHNLLFRRGAQLEQCFQSLIDRTRRRLYLERVKTILGSKRRPYRHRSSKGAAQPRAEVIVEHLTYDLTVFKLHLASSPSRCIAKVSASCAPKPLSTTPKPCRVNGNWLPSPMGCPSPPTLATLLEQLSWLDACFISDETLDTLALPGDLNGQATAGIDLNRARMRAVVQAVLANATLPMVLLRPRLPPKSDKFSTSLRMLIAHGMQPMICVSSAAKVGCCAPHIPNAIGCHSPVSRRSRHCCSSATSCSCPFWQAQVNRNTAPNPKPRTPLMHSWRKSTPCYVRSLSSWALLSDSLPTSTKICRCQCVSAYIHLSFEEFFRTSGMLLGLAGLVLGRVCTHRRTCLRIFLLFVSVCRRKKKVICPYSRKRHMLLADVRSYVCNRARIFSCSQIAKHVT